MPTCVAGLGSLCGLRGECPCLSSSGRPWAVAVASSLCLPLHTASSASLCVSPSLSPAGTLIRAQPNSGWSHLHPDLSYSSTEPSVKVASLWGEDMDRCTVSTFYILFLLCLAYG